MQIGGWTSQGWFQRMPIQYCGRDYGSEFRNAYFFYRAVYHMSAAEACATARGWQSR